MKAYKVKFTATKTMWITQDDINRDIGDVNHVTLTKELAVAYCKGTLVEEIRNDPNRGTVRILEIKE